MSFPAPALAHGIALDARREPRLRGHGRVREARRGAVQYRGTRALPLGADRAHELDRARADGALDQAAPSRRARASRRGRLRLAVHVLLRAQGAARGHRDDAQLHVARVPRGAADRARARAPGSPPHRHGGARIRGRGAAAAADAPREPAVRRAHRAGVRRDLGDRVLERARARAGRRARSARGVLLRLLLVPGRAGVDGAAVLDADHARQRVDAGRRRLHRSVRAARADPRVRQGRAPRIRGPVLQQHRDLQPDRHRAVGRRAAPGVVARHRAHRRAGIIAVQLAPSTRPTTPPQITND